ncbi:MAG: hypothetical protein SFV32_12740 [Opitutaceae bacterium]|nr:hypothetical protein [Opitutaceae bacterium]
MESEEEIDDIEVIREIDIDPVKLKRDIESFDLRAPVRDFLLRRLSIASPSGVASVARDFEEAKLMRRVELLPCYRRAYDELLKKQNIRRLALSAA